MSDLYNGIEKDISHETFKLIGVLCRDLLKECIEENYYDLGKTSVEDIEYYNYLVNTPIVFQDPYGSDDTLFTDIPNGPLFIDGNPVSRDSIIKRCYNYLISQGFTKIQVIGILCNIYQESQFNPRATNGIGAMGLCQWLEPRKSQFVRKVGKPILSSSPEEQLSFAVYELSTTEKRAGNKIREATTVDEACWAWLRYFERPGNYDEEQKKRMSYAQLIYKALSS